MNMQIKIAVAGALALAAGNAFALSPSAIASAVTAGTLKTLYVSGGTSTDNAFENVAKLSNSVVPSASICQAGTLDIYYFKTAAGVAQNRALACSSVAISLTSPTRTLAAGTPIVIFKESHGGSGNGIVNLVSSQPTLAFLDLFSGTSNFATACATSTTKAATGDFAAFSSHDCGYSSSGVASTVSETNIRPDAGLSDEDPATFVGFGGVTAALASNTSIPNKRRGLAVPMNAIVSLPLYLALQKAEGIVATSATGVTDDTSIDTVPTIPASVLSAVLNGTITDGSQIWVGPQGAGNSQALTTQLSTLNLNSASNSTVYLCRRGESSGTSMAFRIMFLNENCGKNASSISTLAASSDGGICSGGNGGDGCAWSSATYGADQVFAGFSSADARACLTYHSQQDQYAIALSSTDALPVTSAGSRITGTFRYIKIDGQAPTLKGVLEENYKYFVENSFNDVSLKGGTSGTAILWDYLYKTATSPAAVADLNTSYRFGAAVGTLNQSTTTDTSADVGLLALSTAGTPALPGSQLTLASVRTNPVNPQTRLGIGSTTANNCNVNAQAN